MSGRSSDGTYRIAHLFADLGIESEVLHTFGEVVRVGIDPEPNPFSAVIQADACNPPLSGIFDLAVAHPKCQRFSKATAGGGSDPEDHPNQIPEAREACQRLADHYIIENVPQAPLHDPVKFTGGMFGMGIHYPRAFETSFYIPQPARRPRFHPEVGPLAEQGKDGQAWVGTNEGWRLAKGYGYEWPARELKRHAVPAPYLRRLLYWWLAAVDDDYSGPQTEQTRLATDGGRCSDGAERSPPEQILDATAGGKGIWCDGQKENDRTLFIDKRERDPGFCGQPNRYYQVQPDEIEDFRDLPYSDESFDLVVFDPPHTIREDGMADLKGHVTKKYGALHAETWQDDLCQGFLELFRVLRPGGTLVFKFADEAADFEEVLQLAPEPPLFGTRTKQSKQIETRWFVFQKERCVQPETGHSERGDER